MPPLTVAQAIDHAIALKQQQGREAAARKLRFTRRAIDSFTPADTLTLDTIDSRWIDDFSIWLTDAQHLSPNTRATYLRALNSALTIAAKSGATVNTHLIDKSLRANSTPRPVKVPAREDTVTQVTASAQWYAMKCRTVDTSMMTRLINEQFDGEVQTFTTSVERLMEHRRGKHLRVVELIRNIIFFRTLPSTCLRMKFAFHDRAYIYDYADGSSRHMAIISPGDMKMFMYFNHIAPERILYYFPDESLRATIAAGTPVKITDGRFRGATGTIIAPGADHPLEATVAIDFPLLGITATAPIPRIFLAPQS